jgi:2-polyprenyl-6-methoxyphenol hydroxylase-like FAD-dependent oxidoreductase
MSAHRSPIRKEADVAIVGAGPTGLLLANLLGIRGVSTFVCDKREVPQSSSMAIGITPPSLEIMKPLGLDRVFRNAGLPVQHAEVYEARTRVGRLDFTKIDSDYPFFLSLPQSRTVELLQQNLSGFPSVAGQDGILFTDLAQDGNGVNATLRDAAGHTLEVRARFLVGADGHRSQVRTAAGLNAREKIYPQRFIMADFKDNSGLGIEARLFFNSEASIESFPLPGGHRRWIVQTEDLGDDDAGQYLIRKVQRLTGFDLGTEPARFVSTFGARRMLVDRYYRGRVVLAGDAAHVMSSIGGQGMNTGFADAEMLAEILPLVLREPARMTACFAAYERIRRQAFEVAATRAERGMWLGTRRGRVASWCRRQFIGRVLFSGLLKRRLAPYFAMLTIPNRNLSQLERGWLTE